MASPSLTLSAPDPRFETTVSRFNSVSVDFVGFKFAYGGDDAIAAWVADVAWACPPFVLEAIRDRILKHPNLSYTHHGWTYRATLCRWLASRFQWTVSSESAIVTTSGVVPALSTAVCALTTEEGAVVIFAPVYYPFFGVVQNNKRRLIVQDLVVAADGTYSIDFEALEAVFEAQSPQMLLLCSPHNPVGRLWTEAELTRLGELCLAHDVAVVSDEIWNNLALPLYSDFAITDSAPRKFYPFAAVAGGKFRDVCVTATSASKAFGMAALQDSAIIIENPVLRDMFVAELTARGQFGGNFACACATEAALTDDGREWLDSSLVHIAQNVLLLRRALLFGLDRIDSALPTDVPHYPYGIRANRPDASYLVWLDCSELVVRLRLQDDDQLPAPATSASDKLASRFNAVMRQRKPFQPPPARDDCRSRLLDFFTQRTGVIVDDGIWFGESGKHHLRINVACARHVLLEALKRIDAALKVTS
jgi:cystathionine beta-lyase